MSKHLLIVESPAKAKTLHKYLGKDFTVLASYGHVRDLVPKSGAVDPDNDFAMKYEVVERNAKHVREIAEAMKQSDDLYLATDPDREGEAISWHLYELLKKRKAIGKKPVYRVVFNEITQQAVRYAVEHPREISMDLVNAQQARRALDYLVGFNLSPLLWRKVQPGLSAGRVQSPALKMIVEREREIEAFEVQEYWKIQAAVKKKQHPFNARLNVFSAKKVEQFTFTSEKEVKEAIEKLEKAAGGVLSVAKVETKERKRHPAPPFITSTMQQEAARKLRFSAQKTMRTAQSLYEAGYITYMRTDSVHLANEAVAAIRQQILQQYGKEYVPASARHYKTKSKNAQEAHEAIRPSDCSVLPDSLGNLNAEQRRLYELIWKRALASQMSSALIEQVSVDLEAGSAEHQFRATGSTIKFPGFMAVYLEDNDDDKKKEEEGILPEITEGEELQLDKIFGSQHFTEPPPRYSEASLIRALEEKDIGRPSTYASIISTLQQREYVSLENRYFKPSMIGKVVNDFLSNHFEHYVDYDFTAALEDELDAVARGEMSWLPLLHSFWRDFAERVEKKQDIPREEVMGAQYLGDDPKTGKPVNVRFGRFGPFVQIGTKDDDEKPLFASIPPDRKVEEVTLEEALEWFKLPRKLGQTEEGEEVSTNIGRYGPYVRYGRKYVSLPAGDDPFTVTLERALQLIAQKKEEDAKKFIKIVYNNEQELKVLNGRFGPYVTDGKINASIPKAINPEEISLEECLALLAKSAERKAKRAAKGTNKTKRSGKKK